MPRADLQLETTRSFFRIFDGSPKQERYPGHVGPRAHALKHVLEPDERWGETFGMTLPTPPVPLSEGYVLQIGVRLECILSALQPFGEVAARILPYC